MRSSLPLAAFSSILCSLSRIANGFVFSGHAASTLRSGTRSHRISALRTSSRPRDAASTRLAMSSDIEAAAAKAMQDAAASPDTPVEFSSMNKMLHVVYRVGNMDKTVKFYQDVFGMKLLRYRDIPEEKYSNAFLGYGTESRGQHFSIELTYNYGVEGYNIGDGMVGMGLRLPDIAGIAARAKDAGAEVVFGPEEIAYGPSLIPDEPVGKKTVEKVVRIKDPDGWMFEVTESPDRRDPVSKVSVLTLDMEKSIAFYEKALGMTLLRRRSLLPISASQASWMGYGPADDNTVIELIYEYSREKITMGDGYGQVAVSTPDVFAAAETIEKSEYKVTRAPGPVPGIGTKITAVRDPDDFKIVLVDEEDIEKELEE